MPEINEGCMNKEPEIGIPPGLIFEEKDFMTMSPKLQLGALYKTSVYLVEIVTMMQQEKTHVCPLGAAIEKKVDAKNFKKKWRDNLWSLFGGIIGSFIFFFTKERFFK